ncbi:MAG: glutamyl-Q tRNA(Asp) synthetase [Pseudomonadota bacterium]
MKSSTASGTTATASLHDRYRGRFAPSPTGPLHLGSLVAALASWLDARAHQGQWLLRIEDLDTPRVVPGAEADIRATLEGLGLHHDGEVLRQSQRMPLYREALESLVAQGFAYRCRCRRTEAEHPYPGTCRDARHGEGPAAWRLRLDTGADTRFEDRIQGRMDYPHRTLGDPVIFRRDGIAAYQLAVVVDDHAQRISDVVRGADLLESTAWQIRLIEALGGAPPAYAHVPLIVEPDGTKLAKSRRSLPVASLAPAQALTMTLKLLRQQPPDLLATARPAQILEWGVAHWNPLALAGQHSLPAS